MSITQMEFEFLLAQEEEFNLLDPIKLGPAPQQWVRQIKSIETKDIFLLDFYRGSFELTKYTYNNRYRQSIILLRYDSKGRHTNPDGELLDGPHVHIYREGFNDKFAFPISEVGVDLVDTMEIVLAKILRFCNVNKIPSIEVPMF